MAKLKLFPEPGGFTTVVVYKTRPAESRTVSLQGVTQDELASAIERCVRKVKNCTTEPLFETG